MRIKILLSFCFTLITFFLKAQKNYPYEKWTPQEISWVKSGSNVAFMDSIEKEILYLCNYVRVNPKLFRETYLQEYIDLNELDIKNEYISSLISELENGHPTRIIKPNYNLQRMAKNHAKKMGKSGKTGHDGFDKRAKKFLRNRFLWIAENCDYGSTTAIDIFMDLLIDKEVLDLGHRKNILSKLNYIGISVEPHRVYGTNCVMDFGYKNDHKK